MKGRIPGVVFAALTLVLLGCSGDRLRTFSEGIREGTAEIFREYEEIVIEGRPRPNFTESDKEIRRNSIRKVRELLDQASEK